MRLKKAKRIVSFTLALTMALGLQVSPVMADEPTWEMPDLRTEITPPEHMNEEIPDDEIVTVIVEMDAPATLDNEEYAAAYGVNSIAAATLKSVANEREQMVKDHEALQNEISQLIPEAVYRYHYTNILNGFAAKIPYGEIETVKNLDGVLDVYMTVAHTYDPDFGVEEEEIEFIPIEQYYARNASANGIDLGDSLISPASDKGSIDLMDLQGAWDMGYTGAGKVVAVFDTDLRITHESFAYMDPVIAAEKPGNYKTKSELISTIEQNHQTLNLFSDGWGSWFHGYDETGFSKEVQHQILNGDFYYNEKVPFAVDYINGDLDVSGTNGHGTHCSGIAVGNPGPNKVATGSLGSAYDAQLFFFKIFDEFDRFAQEGDEATFSALDDAVTLGVNSFSLSLGIKNGFTTMNTYAQAGYQKAYNRAKAAGISVAVAAGNDGIDAHSYALHARPSYLPNAGTPGFSSSLFAPMSIASANSSTYTSTTYILTDMAFVDENGGIVYETIQLKDNNPVRLAETLPNSTLEVVYIGEGSEAEILAATGAEELDGALEAKVALVKGGNNVVEAQSNANLAGAAACIVYNNDADRIVLLENAQTWNSAEMPVLGMFRQSHGEELAALVEKQEVYVSFTSGQYGTNRTTGPGSDYGPVTSTSWGVTDALKLKPEIMAPGGGIWSSVMSGDSSYSAMSGTSMATPNMNGVFTILQQAVDQKIEEGIFDVEPGTIEYSGLVDMLAGSTAKVYTPLSGSVYYSPRRQGAGMVQATKAVTSNVVLHNGNTVTYDPETGEQPRTKVELGDKLGENFTFSFMLENYNDASRMFRVSSVLQTDALSTNSTTGNLWRAALSTAGAEVDPINDAVMTVKAVNGGSIIIPSDNMNRYANGYNHAADTAAISVPAKSSVEVVIEVNMANVDLAYYDARFPSGMFLDGYVWFESNGNENVNIPFMGFRGDWTTAPVFDTVDAYTPINSLSPSEYPMYHVNALHTVVNNGEVVLGANQYTGASWPGFKVQSTHNNVRSYYNNLHNNGNISSEFIAISPGDDGYNDFVYANLALLRTAKAVNVVIKDDDGNIVKVMNPEYEYYEIRDNDGNQTQQIAATYGTKYLRNLEWDGTDENGEIVPDGQYYYEVRAMIESEYLDELGYLAPDEAVLDRLMTSDTVQSYAMPVKVDTVIPYISSTLENNQLTLNVADDSGIQAVAVYYMGSPVGSTILVNDMEFEVTMDLNHLAGDGLNGKLPLNPSFIQIQAVDYALNLTNAYANETVGGNIEPVDEVEVISVAELEPIVVEIDTDFEDIDVPEEVTVVLSNDEEMQLSVVWDEEGYESDVEGTYVLEGALVLPANVLNPEELTAELAIIVEDETAGGEAPDAEEIYINEGDNHVLKKGSQMQLTASIEPLAANPELVWASSNTGVVEVDEDGFMTCVGFGMARVSVTADNGLNYIILVRVV